MNYRSIASLAVCMLVAASVPAFAQWGTQATLASNAFNGTVTIDSAGNLVSAWYQNALPNGTAVNEIWASTAAFGHPWSTPINVSGPIGVASGTPSVRGGASGNATVVYTSPALGGTYADHPSGGSWTAPATTNGVNQLYVSDDNGDEGLAWGAGQTRLAAGYTSIAVVERPAGGVWSSLTTIVTGAHLSLASSLVAPDGSMAVAWESFNAVCGSRTCTTSNWVLHVSTRAAGAESWIDSGPLLGPDSKQHFGQLAAVGVGDLGVLTISGSNIVSLVRHGSNWTSPSVVAATSAISLTACASDSAGHVTLAGFDYHVSTILAVDGNLTNNTWGQPASIIGSDQNPNYFRLAMSPKGTAIVFYSLLNFNGSNTIWRAATRKGSGVAWNPPATAGTSFDGGGMPERVAINGAGQAAVVFHGYSSDFLTYILYSNTYRP